MHCHIGLNHVLARHVAHIMFENMLFWTCSDTDKPFVSLTPRTFSTCTRCIVLALWQEQRNVLFAYCRVSTKIISWLFAKLSLRLFLCAHSVILQSSEESEPTLTAGIIMYCVVGIFTEFITIDNWNWMQIWCIYNVRRWTNCWALYYTGWYRSQWWHLVAIFCLVHVASKEIN